MVTVILGVLGAISAALVSFGLWRIQLIEKRRYEIAEQLVQVATRAVGALRWARSRGGFSGEGSTRPRRPGENPDDTGHLDALYWPIERLASADETFKELWRSQVLCEMHFGVRHGEPFKTLLDTHDEIIRMTRMRLDAGDSVNAESRIEFGLIIHGGDGDKIGPRIDAAFDAIKRLAGSRLHPSFTTLFLPFVTPDHIAWYRGRLRHGWDRLTRQY